MTNCVRCDSFHNIPTFGKYIVKGIIVFNLKAVVLFISELKIVKLQNQLLMNLGVIPEPELARFMNVSKKAQIRLRTQYRRLF